MQQQQQMNTGPPNAADPTKLDHVAKVKLLIQPLKENLAVSKFLLFHFFLLDSM